MDQLSGIDSTFLYLESANAPMHIGGVLFCMPVQPDDRRLDFAACRALVASRLHASPIFRRRVAHVPFDLDDPFWVEDPHFNLDAHVNYMALPGRRGWNELRHLLEHLFAVPLDPRRPLWSLTFVEALDGISGLPPGAFAVVHKMHHAATDGMGGRDLVTTLLDPTPRVRTVPGAGGWMPDMQPTATQFVAQAAMGLLKRPAQALRAAGAVAGGVMNLGMELLLGREDDAPGPALRAPRTRFNVPIEPQRVFGAVRAPLAALRAARLLVNGATLNDVVLTVCAGALRRYLGARAELPAESLTALVPIAVRRGLSRTGGNRLSGMIVTLATHASEVVTRLERIHASARANREYAGALGTHVLSDLAQMVPYPLGTAASRLYAQARLTRYHPPLFNLVISNVPGPRQPLYLNGARVLSSLGTAPIIDGLGLIIVVTTYLDELSISVTACPSVLPDVEFFEQCLQEALHELDGAIRASGNEEAIRRARRPAVRAVSAPQQPSRFGR